jgi:hypothetical protein
MNRLTKAIFVNLAFLGIAAIEVAFDARFHLAGVRIFCGVLILLSGCYLLYYVSYALSKGEVGVSTKTGGGIISREKDPAGFWIFLCVYAAIGGFFLYSVVAADIRLYEGKLPPVTVRQTDFKLVLIKPI